MCSHGARTQSCERKRAVPSRRTHGPDAVTGRVHVRRETRGPTSSMGRSPQVQNAGSHGSHAINAPDADPDDFLRSSGIGIFPFRRWSVRPRKQAQLRILQALSAPPVGGRQRIVSTDRPQKWVLDKPPEGLIKIGPTCSGQSFGSNAGAARCSTRSQVLAASGTTGSNRRWENL